MSRQMTPKNFTFEPVPEDLALRQFREAMADSGVFPLAGLDSLNIVRDGKIHKFDVEGGRRGNQAGRYLLYNDNGPIAGWFQDWRQMAEPVPWCFDYRVLRDDPNYRTAFEQSHTPEFKAALNQKQKERKKVEAEERARASDMARAYFDTCKSAPEDHSYLVKKQVAKYGDLRLAEDDLLIPLKDERGRFMSYQRIAPDGSKKFCEGCPVRGARFTIAEDIAEGPILVTEGYATAATVYEGTNMMTVCAFNCHNLLPVCQSLRKAYPGRKIILMADDDAGTKEKTGKNPGMAAAAECVKAKAADDVIEPPFDRKKDGLGQSDWNDYASIYGLDATEKLLREMMGKRNKQAGRAVLRIEEVNAADLMRMEFPPIKWAVDGFIPTGCAMLAGHSKIGKSILALQIALAVAEGGFVLGQDVEQGDVLYLALEDTQKRLQVRMCDAGVNPDAEWLSRLTLTTTVPRQHEGGIDYLSSWLREHHEARLVIVDTLQKFRTPHSKGGDKYGDDYDVLGELKDLADAHDVAILTLHHLNKSKVEDWTQGINGTNGIMGAVDTLLRLERPRTETLGTLRITGRDVEEADYAVSVDFNCFRWTLEGALDGAKVTGWKKDIIDILKTEARALSPKAIGELLGGNVKDETMKKRLARMKRDGLILGHSGSYWVTIRGEDDT